MGLKLGWMGLSFKVITKRDKNMDTVNFYGRTDLNIKGSFMRMTCMEKEFMNGATEGNTMEIDSTTVWKGKASFHG